MVANPELWFKVQPAQAVEETASQHRDRILSPGGRVRPILLL
jgi:hypothetical protein